MEGYMSDMLLKVGGERVYNAARTPGMGGTTNGIVLKENMQIHSIIERPTLAG